MKKTTATNISKKLNISNKEFYSELVKQKLIYNKDDKWCLTEKGIEYGGEVLNNKKYGEFFVWPCDFNPFNLQKFVRKDLVNATIIGNKFNLSSQRVNFVLAEIGWTEKAIKGWSVTSLGRKVGGVQLEHSSGGTYVKWPKEILDNKTLLTSINNLEQDELSNKDTSNEISLLMQNYRTKYPATFRTKDGHMVRSRAEVIIDNALYDYGLVHAYERKLPIKEDVYSDFYIPSKNGGKAVYIEFWGMENDSGYARRKEIKKKTYQKHGLNLIEVIDKHIENLDDHLPRMLLKYNIKVE